jgi:hypothetical protein
MSILINPQHRRIDIYRYTINLPGCPGDGKEITIQFCDGKFDSAYYNFKGTYSREQWKVLGAIAGMIPQIEKQLEEVLK